MAADARAVARMRLQDLDRRIAARINAPHVAGRRRRPSTRLTHQVKAPYGVAPSRCS